MSKNKSEKDHPRNIEDLILERRYIPSYFVLHVPWNPDVKLILDSDLRNLKFPVYLTTGTRIENANDHQIYNQRSKKPSLRHKA